MKSGQTKETTGLVTAPKGHTSEGQPTLVSKPTGLEGRWPQVEKPYGINDITGNDRDKDTPVLFGSG